MARLKSVGLLCLAGALCGPDVLAQQVEALPNDTLALIGRRAVTSRDLIERLELMPWPGKDRLSNMDSIKVKALQSLVAETILGLESRAEGVVPDSIERLHERNLEKIFVRDQLYRREVEGKVGVDSEEISEGLGRFADRVTVLMIGAGDRGRALTISRALLDGGSPDSIIAHPPGGISPSVDTISVTFGLLEKEQEDAVYKLSDSVRASPPVEADSMGWVVLYLLRKETDPEYARSSVPQRTEIVLRRIRKRKEIERAGDFKADELSGSRADVDRETFALFARSLRSIFVADSGQYRTPAGYRIDQVVDRAEDVLKPHFNDVLVRLEDGTMTVADALEGFRTTQFALPSLRPGDFFPHLNGALKELVARDLLARNGYRLHLEQTEEVRHDVSVWSMYWSAQALMQKLTSDVTITNNDVLRSMMQMAGDIGHEYEVNVREILSDSLRVSLAVIDRISGGAPMDSLAREVSRRRAWALRGGESGFFPVGRFPEIGFAALDAAPGSLIGPVKVPEGYSVFVVLGKRGASGGSLSSYDSLKATVRSELLNREIQNHLNRFVAGAAERYGVKLSYDRLKKVDIPPINMVTKRFIGFGGSMLAVPSIYPLWQWVMETRSIEEIFP